MGTVSGDCLTKTATRLHVSAFRTKLLAKPQNQDGSADPSSTLFPRRARFLLLKTAFATATPPLARFWQQSRAIKPTLELQTSEHPHRASATRPTPASSDRPR
jgi:hypothetical protein